MTTIASSKLGQPRPPVDPEFATPIELAQWPGKEVEKAYDPNQLRGPDGRWVKGGGIINLAPNTDSAEWHTVIAEIRDQGIKPPYDETWKDGGTYGMGNCFEAAVTLLENADKLGLKNARIVQGTVMGDSGNMKGTRYVHAWVEADSLQLEGHPEATHRDAYDYSSGHSTVMPAAMYRHFGKAMHITTYDWDQAVEQMLAKGHYGPWSDELKGHV